MTTKNFKKSASEFFINEAGNDQNQEAPKPPKSKSAKQEAPAGFKVPRGYKLTKEARSERIQLLVRPSTKDILKAEADTAGKSLNEYVNDLLEEHLRKGGK